jgi:hypothetical protein
VDHRASPVQPDRLAALQDEMAACGLRFENKSGELPDSASATLRQYQPGR